MLTTATESVMRRLRDETAALHQHAESRALEQAMVTGTVSREVYSEVLSQRLLIHAALEKHIRALAQRDSRIALIIRETLFQENNLRQDLAVLGVDATTIVPRKATRALVAEIQRLGAEDPLSLLGIYYVFEGSKNGARYIARKLRPALGLQPGPGALYLDPHGEQQRPYWEEFKKAVDQAGFSATEADGMVAAAKITFEMIAALDDEMYPG